MQTKTPKHPTATLSAEQLATGSALKLISMATVALRNAEAPRPSIEDYIEAASAATDITTVRNLTSRWLTVID